MTLVRWNPARELASMEVDRLNRMFGEFFDRAVHRSWVPAVDIYETEAHEYVIKAELPEMKREDISVTFDNNVLTLKGERKVEYGGANAQRLERNHGSFTRSFVLPTSVDGNRITASYKDGVLVVRVPQREDAKPKQIAVQD
ncbi:MAG TPA: Hsp20/alpha crystallin family protein [Vicinamibacterales bacterium]